MLNVKERDDQEVLARIVRQELRAEGYDMDIDRDGNGKLILDFDVPKLVLKCAVDNILAWGAVDDKEVD